MLMCLESWSKQLSNAAVRIMHMLVDHCSCIILGHAMHSNAHLSCPDWLMASALMTHEGQFAFHHALSCGVVC